MFYSSILFQSLVLLKSCRTIDYSEGWNYINLHCRDNDNAPVEWWYIYKPPDLSLPYLQRVTNFTYITPATNGRWQFSSIRLNANSMLQHTLSPLFRSTYSNHIAAVAYDRRTSSKDIGTSAYGVLMADELGGVWIGHSVPGLLDMSKEMPTFPMNESANGHILMCLSLDLFTLNKIGAQLTQLNPKFTAIHIPPVMEEHLPMWKYLKSPEHFVLRSVRNIETISIKAPGHVTYIMNKMDRAGFAVSTAAHWQRTGASPKQHWACINSYDERHSYEALIVCVNDYNVWLSFDNLKTKEPEC